MNRNMNQPKSQGAGRHDGEQEQAVAEAALEVRAGG